MKVDAGSRDLLRGLKILVAVDDSREGGIFLGKLRMDFGHNPFGLGSSCTCSSLRSPRHHHRVQWDRAEPVAMRRISCVAKEIGGKRRVVVEGWHYRGIFSQSTTPLEILPCLLKRHTQLLPTTSRSHLDVTPATGNDILQTPNDVWVALHCSVAESIDGCLRGNVGDKLELGAGVDVLKLSDGVVVKIVLAVIKKERATALPL